MAVTLVKGRYLVCGVDGRDQAKVIEDGAVVVRGNRIEALGPRDALEGAADYDRVLGGPDHVVFPGFINAHHHVGLTPLQLGAPDLPLELWINRRLGGRVVDLYLDTLYSAFELVRSGVTTVQHLHGRVPGPIDKIHKGARQVIGAYQDLGMRVSYSYGIRDQNRIVYEADEAFLARLPKDLAADLAPMIAAQSVPLADNFDLFTALCGDYEGDSRVAVQLAPVNLQWCSDQALRQVAELSQKHDVPMHMHLLETPYQKAYARKRSGASAVGYLGEMGLLGPLMTLGHGVWVSEPELDLLAESGTRICHNCSSNFRLRSGVAPLNEMRRRGIEVAIGIDEAGLNDDRDMLQELRLVLRAHRVPGMDDAVPTAAEVFRMGTEFGARTTGFGDRIGRIEAGREADLVLLRWSQVAHPYLDPDVPVVDALVQRGRSQGVEAVMVDGEMVLDDGRFTRVDEAAVLDELARSLSGPPSKAERRSRDVAKRLMPYIRDFYENYLYDLDLEPYYGVHSRR